MTVTIVNGDAAGVGFNDATPATPIGGNPGTTLGAQRLDALQYAAAAWGAALDSTVPVVILARFSAGPTCAGEPAAVAFTNVHRNFTGAPFLNTHYLPALANKLAGTDLDPFSPDFELYVCVPASSFYLGLDDNHGAQIDLVTALLHQIAHGLGFWNLTAASSGAFLFGFPSVWDHFILDNTTGELWIDMTEAERSASVRNFRHVVWTGANVTAAVPGVYALDYPRLVIGGPEGGAAAGEYAGAAATFGAPLVPTPLIDQLMPALLDGNGFGGACAALGSLDALAVQGNVALIERGGCADVVQAKNVQNAGAIAAILIDDTPTVPPPSPTGADPTVTIPAIAISQADGETIKAQLLHRGRRASGVTAALRQETPTGQYLGADPLGRALLYTPVNWVPSAASHWDPSATPNQLLEPTLNGDVSHALGLPDDLTVELLKDIGW